MMVCFLLRRVDFISLLRPRLVFISQKSKIIYSIWTFKSWLLKRYHFRHGIVKYGWKFGSLLKFTLAVCQVPIYCYSDQKTASRNDTKHLTQPCTFRLQACSPTSMPAASVQYTKKAEFLLLLNFQFVILHLGFVLLKHLTNSSFYILKESASVRSHQMK